MKKICQGIFIAFLFVPPMAWVWMTAHIHQANCLYTEEGCKEDILNAKITNIN